MALHQLRHFSVLPYLRRTFFGTLTTSSLGLQLPLDTFEFINRQVHLVLGLPPAFFLSDFDLTSAFDSKRPLQTISTKCRFVPTR